MNEVTYANVHYAQVNDDVVVDCDANAHVHDHVHAHAHDHVHVPSENVSDASRAKDNVTVDPSTASVDRAVVGA